MGKRMDAEPFGNGVSLELWPKARSGAKAIETSAVSFTIDPFPGSEWR